MPTRKKKSKNHLSLLLVMLAILGGAMLWVSFKDMNAYLKAIPATDFCSTTYKSPADIKTCTHNTFKAVDRNRVGSQALSITGAALLTGSVILLSTLPNQQRKT
ncbi:hypothetical protein BVY00_00495 [bacterium G20]|nr:hypothetical protein BVY00_00495 [bacterium G20]